MGTRSVRQRIESELGQIGGISTASTDIPRTVADSELPAAVVVPLRATYDVSLRGEGVCSRTRTFSILLLFERAAYGTEGEYQGGVEDLIDEVVLHLMERPGLVIDGETEPRESALDSRVVEDMGVQLVTYAGEEFIGSTITMTVDEVIEVEYHD